MDKKYRLITRSDFDGVVSAVLLRELDLIDEIKFVHPKDMQDGKIEVSEQDITANLPYVPGVHLAFDHHFSESLRVFDTPDNHVIEASAPSAARVIYNYYGGRRKFAKVSQEMMAAVDQSDSAQFSLEEILHPQDWVLLSFLMDARTGLGRFREFTISNYQLMMNLIESCRHLSIGEILTLPDVQERVELYQDHAEKFKDQLRRCASVHEQLVTLELRSEEVIYAGNRFMVYALFPQCNLSMHVMWGVQKQNVVFAVGKSILNRTSPLNIGQLMLHHEGGGHANAGTCQIPCDRADEAKQELIEQITVLNRYE
ncbi:MAG: exopolyphosphatase [Oscillatoriales cyanobacterium SM2_2_1]|nr:exopolyphosphatase [Oscillatoriales cyanobacterium SM2_2_1]